MSIEQAHLRHARALAAFREAHRTLAEDRNRRAGEVYETQKALNEAVREHLAAEYAASWVDRWPA